MSVLDKGVHSGKKRDLYSRKESYTAADALDKNAKPGL
jgi:hypothetical protein